MTSRASKPRLVHIFTVPTSLEFVRGQARYLQDQGFDVHVVAAPDGDAMARFAATEGVETHELFMTRAMTPAQDTRSLVRLWRLLRKLEPDIVHASTPKGGFLGMLASSFTGVPVRIYHMHGIRGFAARGWRRTLLLLIERFTCRLATRVLCVSGSNRDAAIALRLCSPEKMIVLGAGSCNGVDARTRFNPGLISDDQRIALRQSLAIPVDAPVIGFVGRVVRDKGIVELAQAWSRLAEQFPALYLVVVGAIEEQDPVPESILRPWRAHERVRFVSPVPDIAPYYGIMNLVVLPTYREGLPTVLLEAAAMRLPVVATNVPGCTDVVVDGVTGTLVPPRSAASLAASIATYLGDSRLREDHGAQSRNKVLRDFVPEAVWREVFCLYRSELSKRIRLFSDIPDQADWTQRPRP